MSDPPGAAGSWTRRIQHPLVWFWIYTAARIAVFGVLFGLLWLFGVRSLLGAALALVLSVPLSYVILIRPRAALAAALHDRFVIRQERTDALDAQLSDAPSDAPPARPTPPPGSPPPAGDVPGP